MDKASSLSTPAAPEPPSHHPGLSDASSDQSIGDSESIVSGHSDTTRDTNSKSFSHTDDAIADGLTNVVGRWRACVVIMLLVTATLVVTTTYIFLSNSEQEEFQKSFQMSAKSIMDSVEFHATNAVATFETLAAGITSEALTSNATWPFFTIDNFEVKAAHARLNAFAEGVFFMPLVLGKQRAEWEAYSLEHAAHWLQQSRVLGHETDKWLHESSFYRLASGKEDTHTHTNNTSTSTNNNQARKRELEKTTLVIIGDNTNRTDTFTTTAVVQRPTTTTTTPSTPPPTQNPDYAIQNEIFLKGEDMPGGTGGDVTSVSESWRAFYAPVWQVSPPPMKPTLVNYNMLADATSAITFNALQASGNKAIISELLKTSSIDYFYNGLMTTDEHWGYHSSSDATGHARTPGTFPHSSTIAPIRANFEPSAPIVGLVMGIAPWDLYLSRLLPEGVNGVYAVLSNSCAQVVTYKVMGPTAVFLGVGDLHDTRYDYMKQTLNFTGFGLSTEASRKAGQCDYYLSLYASDEYQTDYDNHKPAIVTAVLAAVFVATGIVFLIFAMYVQRRQRKILATATRTNAIVTAMFPANVRARILKEAEAQLGNKNQFDRQKDGKSERRTDAQNLSKYLEAEKEGATRSYIEAAEDSDEAVISTNIFGSKPIADLFPETTLMFGDLVGFTAWSSMRDPSSVFTLLETVYHSFDQLANKRRVFKVETVGDCYVAVTGLPEPRKDHAVIMSRFAKDCLDKLPPLLKRLEIVLGPDTGDLSMRFGLHSGPVTAGVLRGERARFQLFGDTMNTCSRIESTGRTGHIHISQQTADLLKAAGKENWYIPRKDKVVAKGKGELQTYWLTFKQQETVSSRSGGSSRNESIQNDGEAHQGASNDNKLSVLHPMGAHVAINKNVKLSKKAVRLVEWNVDILTRLLQQIVARRESEGRKTLRGVDLGPIERDMMQKGNDRVVMDEVKEIIQLPKYDPTAARNREQVDHRSIKLRQEVIDQLRAFVAIIASLYHDTVPFHNFEHASHVTMSVVKLLSRIVAPKGTENGENADFDKELHDHTYGIASDPLTQFSVVLSALIHDVDHVGVPNVTLVKEKAGICARYRNQSVAEQHSVELAWTLLMDPDFQDLRATIYSSTEELTRFRQLLVNTVLATDIVDKELKELRNARWDRAFHKEPSASSASSVEPPQDQGKLNMMRRRSISVYNDDTTNRKATIVIEHIIQASDIAHTMQHWHIYRKWNEKFFEENMLAYKLGRAEKDPSEYWYKGEIGFFDFYIIPLAKKLEECGVFGVSSHEYRQYALNNREEWLSKGEQIVADMKARYAKKEEDEAMGDEMDGKRLSKSIASSRRHETFQNEVNGTVSNGAMKG